MTSKKDYIKVAEIIGRMRKQITAKSKELYLIHEFSKWFSEDNPQFNYEKFKEACNK